MLFNTAAIAVLSTIGAVVSSILVAYGFARFRFPGQEHLLLHPARRRSSCPSRSPCSRRTSIFTKLGWNGTWLPLIIPHFFANAFNVFLLRQYFMTIPRDLDEAAMIDGAGPFRILRSRDRPAVDPGDHRRHAVPLLLRLERLLRAAAVPGGQARAAAAVDRRSSSTTRSTRRQPTLIQAAALMTMAVPVVVFFLAQRAFMRGVVVTGVEK